MTESARQALVVPITLLPHGNADSLSVVEVDGNTVVVNTAMWQGHNHAVFIPPETIVQTTRTEFSFLDRGRGEELVSVKRLRGVWSMGLLVPTPEGFNIGDDLYKYFGLKHYEPEEQWVGGVRCGNAVKAPTHWANLPKYDIENWRKYKREFKDGELVNISQKYHGSFWAAVYSEGDYRVRSKGFWRENDNNDYYLGLQKHESIMKFLRDNPDTLLCGEVVGKIQKGFSYGVPPGEIEVRAFDMRRSDYSWYGVADFYNTANDAQIPVVEYDGDMLMPYSDDLVLQFTDGQQAGNPNGIKEGVVVRTEIPRFSKPLNGRLILKSVSNIYLGSKK
jgi:RNA ligase (TIGR02306 family)